MHLWACPVFPPRWWRTVWTSTRRGSIPQSSSTCWKTTTTTCWSAAFSWPFSLPPWSANAWQKSNCSTELGGKVTDEQTPISVGPREAARRTSQPDERQLRSIPVEEHRSKFNKAHMELQGWGNEGWGWRLEGLEQFFLISFGFVCFFVFFNLFCKPSELLHSSTIFLGGGVQFKSWSSKSLNLTRQINTRILGRGYLTGSF